MNKEGSSMNKRIFRRSIVAVAVLGAFALSGTALAIDEVEQNHPISSAQALSNTPNTPLTDAVTLQGAINNPATPDVDFYSFYARKGDKLNFAIESKTASGMMFLPVLTVFIGTSPWEKKDQLYNVDLPRIDNYLVDRDGLHVVAVSGQPCVLVPGGLCPSNGTMVSPRISMGTYTLRISPATPPEMQVKIEIKPGSGALTPVNPKAKGNIPVALLSSDLPEFKPFGDVDVSRESLTFGSTGVETSLRKCEKEGVDLNADGVPDMVCHFENQDAKFQPDDSRATLKGKTKDGRSFTGSGMLKVVPPQQEH
jgi:hypothetical protein